MSAAAPRWFRADLLAGEVAVVTGGSSGLGWEIARALLDHGASVAIASRSAERLDDAAARLADATGRSCVPVVCDVRDGDAVARLRSIVADRLGAATIVVNNAAANFQVRAERMTERAFSTVVDVDLKGTFLVTTAFVPAMLELGRGCVLSIVIPDPHRGFPLFSHAGAAKAAIVSLTSSWAREWGPRGVRVNAIGPGPVNTPGASEHMFGRTSEDAFSEVVERLPLRRLGTPADVAQAAVFLCSPAASWITAVVLNVDGGLSVA